MASHRGSFPVSFSVALIFIAAPLLGAPALQRAATQHPAPRHAPRAQRKPRRRALAGKRPARRNPTAAQARELETLAIQTRDPNRRVADRAFVRLVALERHWTGIQHDRAALVLGYYDYLRKRYAYARAWFRAALRDPMLGRYALYWEGVVADTAGQDADALALLGDFLRRYPDSVMKEPALEAFSDAAIGANQPGRAIVALNAYPGTDDSPTLLLNLALAREHTGDLVDAAYDFEHVYYRFPLKPSAQDAKKGIDRVRARLGAKFPEPPLADRIARANTLFKNRRWHHARTAWERVRDSASGIERDRAELHVAECDARIKGNPAAIEKLSFSDRALQADRWLGLFLAYRHEDNEDGMQFAVAEAVKLAAAGAPAKIANRALYLMGDYYWANLKRDQAVAYYRLLLGRAPYDADAPTAHWRIAWTAYLENHPNADALIRAQIDKYPYSSYVPDALYWLGRLAERSGEQAEARAYYAKLSSRFAETYFGRLARQRLGHIRTVADPPGILPVLDRIPPIPPRSSLMNVVPTSVRTLYDRAVALRSIAFNDSATLEFRAAYRRSRAPRLLIDAALAAQGARQYLTGAALARLLVPDLESHPIDTVPLTIWRIVYPLPYAQLIRYYAGHYDIDPMLLASLIRQESGFRPDIVSKAGAVGLAQLEPYTARKWSRRIHLWYSRRSLVDPRYNLRVGGAYFHALDQEFGSVEAALAAYNAGEVRVSQWLADRHYADPAEFVESIPFSQTRHYVEVVLNGSVIYHRLYEAH